MKSKEPESPKPLITCRCAGYGSALVRGAKYEVFGLNEEKDEVRVRNLRGRLQWYGRCRFDFANGFVPTLTEWCFDDPVIDPLNRRDENNNNVDVVFTLSDGTKRWCVLVTPDYLKELLEPRSLKAHPDGSWEPAVWGKHVIVIRDLLTETVDWLLKHLDDEDELIDHSLPIEQEKDPLLDDEDSDE